jgi:hypothetical protein
MKRRYIGMLASSCFAWVLAVQADTTVDSAHPYAYGANVGWINARGDITNGAVLGQSYCTGYLWSANCGWIGLGNGPTNGWQYGNAAGDWGVNHDGAGNLSGYAYGANIGWINFEQTHGQPRISLLTGNLSGYVWGANVGWISLSNAQAYVRTDTLSPGADTDGDEIPDPWEYRMAGNLTTLSGNRHDEDFDGVPDTDEYGADTDPTNDLSTLAITDIQCFTGTNRLTWTVELTRLYGLQQAAALTGNVIWTDSGLGLMLPDAGASMTRDVYNVNASSGFYRVKAVVPLTP